MDSLPSSSSASSSSDQCDFNGGNKRLSICGYSVGQKGILRISLILLGLAVWCVLFYKEASPLQLLSLSVARSTIRNASSETEAKELDQVLRNASMENHTVIITTLNQAWAERGSVFDLFLESFRIGQGTERLLRHVLVVCLDRKAYERCSSEQNLHCYELSMPGTNFSSEKVYMSPDYLKLGWQRIEFLLTVLEKGFNFLLTDADIVWLRDPFPRLYPDGDIQLACDQFYGDSNKNNMPNIGFIYAKSNRRTIQFFKFWLKSSLIYPGLQDQDVFNRIKNEPFVSKIGIEIRFFDTVYFGGFCQPSRDINLVCTMHANCCMGLKVKVRSLNLVLSEWRKYLMVSKTVTAKNTTWSAPMKF